MSRQLPPSKMNIRKGIFEREGHEVKRRPQQYFCGKQVLQETGLGESCGVPQCSGKDFV